MTSTSRSIIGAILILICTLCTAFISSSITEGMSWVDFTSNSRYSLTEGSVNVLKKLRRPLKARLYYSREAVNAIGTNQLKPYNRAYAYIRDLLRAYARASGGKIEFLEIDPKTYSKEADEAANLGVTVQPLRGQDLSFSFGLACSCNRMRASLSIRSMDTTEAATAAKNCPNTKARSTSAIIRSNAVVIRSWGGRSSR